MGQGKEWEKSRTTAPARNGTPWYAESAPVTE